MASEIVLFGYDLSFFSQKVEDVLCAKDLRYRMCEQPVVLPRPDLEALGITYRRIPIMAIGRDVYCDSSLIIDVLEERFPDKAFAAPELVGYAKGLEYWASDELMPLCVTLLPFKVMQDPVMRRDRINLFRGMYPRGEFTEAVYTERREVALEQLLAHLLTIEETLLAPAGPFVGGNNAITLLDIQLAFLVEFALVSMHVGTSDPRFRADRLPRIHRWLESYRKHLRHKRQNLRTIVDISQVKEGLSKAPTPTLASSASSTPRLGDEVLIVGTDSPGNVPQRGTLARLTATRSTIKVGDLLVHFPRIKYSIRPVTKL